MDKARLKINNQEIGLRKIEEDLFEPKSTEVLIKVLHGQFNPSNKRKLFYVNPFPEADEEVQKIESFCFVTSHNRVQEAKILLYSLRLSHDEPGMIMCDEETEEELRGAYDNIIFVTKINQDYLDKIRKKILNEKYAHLEKEHHCRSDYIYLKMECMNEALTRFTNTFFLDTDIIVLDSLQENFTKKVVLSPHYYDINQIHFGYEYGFYNAGYIFCSDRGFPQYWKKMYLNDSVFYEQECMNRINTTYKIETFDESHNCGFWRKHEIPEKTKSLHVHFSYDLYDKIKDNDQQYKLHSEFRDLSSKYLKENNKKIYHYISKIAPKYINPSKLAFVHFGKCGGVYVNRYLHEVVFPHHTQYMSWHEGLNPKGVSRRDFNEEELFEIAETAEENSIVHNHHVSWTGETLKKFKENEFLTFGFLRDPRDIICSLYFFASDEYLKHGDNHFLAKELIRGFDEIDPSKITLDDFFIHIAKHSRRGWVLPDYIDDIDFLAEFNNDNFSYFMKKYFNHDHVPQKRKNATANKGYKHYCKSGELSQSTQELIENDPDCIKHIRLLESARQIDDRTSVIKET